MSDKSDGTSGPTIMICTVPKPLTGSWNGCLVLLICGKALKGMREYQKQGLMVVNTEHHSNLTNLTRRSSYPVNARCSDSELVNPVDTHPPEALPMIQHLRKSLLRAQTDAENSNCIVFSTFPFCEHPKIQAIHMGFQHNTRK